MLLINLILPVLRVIITLRNNFHLRRAFWTVVAGQIKYFLINFLNNIRSIAMIQRRSFFDSPLLIFIFK